MNQRFRRGAIGVLIALGAVAVTLPLDGVQFFRTLNLKVLDSHFAFRSQKPTRDIVLVLTDQKALDTFPELQMFWHPYYAAAIRAAGEGGAKVIGLDLSFGVPVEKWEPDLDSALAEAVVSSPIPVVLAYVPEHLTNQERLTVPVNMYAAATGRAGFPNLTDDSDQFIRRQELFEKPSETVEPEARSLPLRVVEQYFGKEAVVKDGSSASRSPSATPPPTS
jgi:CHASE2 domain-containing sensor protein